MPHTVFASLDEAMAELSKLTKEPARARTGPISLSQAMVHCAQSIECSVRGYPEDWPMLLRATVGKVVLGRFMSKGFMAHDLAKPVPGLPPEPEQPLPQAWERLQQAVEHSTVFSSGSELESFL